MKSPLKQIMMNISLKTDYDEYLP